MRPPRFFADGALLCGCDRVRMRLLFFEVWPVNLDEVRRGADLARVCGLEATAAVGALAAVMAFLCMTRPPKRPHKMRNIFCPVLRRAAL